jgi:hypothetical protein
MLVPIIAGVIFFPLEALLFASESTLAFTGALLIGGPVSLYLAFRLVVRWEAVPKKDEG